MDLFLVYLICFGVGLVFAVVSFFVADVVGGHDVHHDIGTGGHTEGGFDHGSGMPGFSVVSPTIIASFITAFGGLGMIFSKIEMTRSPWLSMPLAALGGVIIAGLIFWLFDTIFSKTQSSSESRVGLLVGLTGTIISGIPEHGVGEIAYVHGGSRYTAPARSETGAAIAVGQTVKIKRVVGTQFFVILE